MTTESGDSSPRPIKIVSEVEFVGEEEMPIVLANHVFVRTTQDGLIVSFAQSHGPYIVNPTQEDIELMGKVPARIVARLLIPPHRMKTFIKLITQVMQVKIDLEEIEDGDTDDEGNGDAEENPD